MIGERIIVVGNTGSGKTTLARQLAQRLDCAHVELDALHWGPNWTTPALPEFRQRISDALQGDCWVADGNYSGVRDIIWAQADTLLWLDYPLPTVLRQLVGRGLKRVRSQEELWNGNRETWRGLFFSRDSLFIWAFKKQWSRRREYPQLLQQPEYAHLTAVRLKSPRQTQKWLATLTHQHKPATRPLTHS